MDELLCAVVRRLRGLRQRTADEGLPGVPGPLVLASTDYHLAWSSHPRPDFYKHEYVPQGQNVERYQSMLMLDLLGDAAATAEQLMGTKVAELEQRKASDPVVNYDALLSESKDQALLDFVVSATDAEGNTIVEWNAYRYVSSPAGNGVLMIGLSRRAYGDTEIRALFAQLKAARARDIKALAAMPVPALKLRAETP
ncbi:hypothetical protein NYQ43_01535 [Xanthomonas translucens pv. translucens]|uniref:hypothetical protein n=1 Tax=Xanthomonas campestris pv. translucens TaxID=343 RepID=UPI0021B73A8B|nr:hypothetical protein [Xanthomonas translucens]MCT8284404.1 hypothetical protein [Xanthomonas translucens pv. translucens]MCT8302062.1 hypothetical protein [Xanthomonas translucens pv. translucens]